MIFPWSQSSSRLPMPSLCYLWPGSAVLPRTTRRVPSMLPSGLWTCGCLHQAGAWTPGPQTPQEAQRCPAAGRAPCGLGICSVWPRPDTPSSLAILTGSAPPPLPSSIGWPLNVCVGGLGWGRPLSGKLGWGRGLSFLLFIALGLWGGFPWPPPPPQGRGRSLGESQAWGGSLSVRRSQRSLVTELLGLRALQAPGPQRCVGPRPRYQPPPVTGHPPGSPILAVLIGAYLGAGASWGHGERGGLILRVL